jgi:hypothetical protein
LLLSRLHSGGDQVTHVFSPQPPTTNLTPTNDPLANCTHGRVGIRQQDGPPIRSEKVVNSLTRPPMPGD